MEATEPVSQVKLDDLFPFERVRKGQDQFLEEARNCFASRTHLLAHAPTGMGKTAVSLSAGLECSLAQGGFLFFLTAKQSQHAAAIECLRQIWRKRKLAAVDIVAREGMCLARRRGGRSPCLDGTPCYFRGARVEEAAGRLLDYPLHVQEAVGLCLRLGACPYLASLKALRKADVAVCDFNQVFTLQEGLLARTGNEAPSTCLVVDEAHNLTTRIMDNHSAELDERRITQASNDPRLKRMRGDIESVRDAFRAVCKAGSRRGIEPWELDERMAELCGTGSSGLAQEMAEELGDDARSGAPDLSGFLSLWSAFGKGSTRFVRGTPSTLHCRLLDPALVAAPVLERVRCALLMSGTLHPPEMFAEMLGIRERAACRRYPAPFPSENRMVRAVPGVSSRFQQRSEAMYQSISRRLREVSEHVPGNLAVFFPSYDFMSAVMFQLRSSPLGKQVLADSRELSKNEREAMLLEMRREGNRALFASMGGSFTEGVDFHDNLLSAVVVVGLPLSPPSEELDALASRLADKFGTAKAKLYSQTYPAIAKVLQASGRAIRSEKDRAAIILLDERYLLPPVSTALPEEHRPLCSRDLGRELDEFFGKPPDGTS
ncbi:MAG: ATP-dependent DNA helicase [Methanomassiliicoccales archaeon]|nr:ATP-dependent DNA helicase [Methanomassiliicoccales archaeon]